MKSKIDIINKYFFQWLFLRLVKVRVRLISNFEIYEVSLVGSGISIGGKIKESKTIQWYEIQGFVKPLSCWKSNFKKAGKQFRLKLTKKKHYEQKI